MNEEMKACKSMCEEKHPTAMPENVKSAIFKLAWENGHAYGCHEVCFHYEDLLDLSVIAYGAAK